MVRRSVGTGECDASATAPGAASPPERAAERLSRELARRRLEEARPLAPSAAALAVFRQAGLLGESPALMRSLALAERSARSPATLYLEGETGTGKELLACAIHRLSDRAHRPLVAQNCAALPEGTLESELFGHTRGAFTGAVAARRGLFEVAAGGTLFLDEISEASLATQAKLLRVLQEQEIRPIGSERAKRVDVRVIAASNRDLRSEVEQGRFRADLFHRLSILPVRLPPLRERAGDVEILTDLWLCGGDSGPRGRRLDPGARLALASYRWPGNVRELRNEIQRLLVQTEPERPIRLEDLAEHIRGTLRPTPLAPERTLREIVAEVESATILARLRSHGYRRGETARSLGISREALWARLRRLGSGPSRKSTRDPRRRTGG